MLTMMLQEKELIESTDFTHVRHVSMASSPVSKSLFSDLKRIFSNAVIQNAYGITEVSPGMFGRHPSKPTPDLSVGYPLPGIDYRIVNGILQVRSPSMLLGYNKIITRNLTEDGYFITNDLFNVDQDGFYFFIGRADDMFVSGGNNVYPRQIETILEEHPLVKNSAVVGLDDDIKGVKPYAFIQGNVSESVIMEYVKTQLPPSHWPRRIWNLDIIPLNSVNKVDKRKLKEVALANLNTICTTQN